MAKRTVPSADVPLDFLSGKELKSYIQSAGKTAQSRLKALEKAYSPGGSLAGRRSFVLDKYGDLNVKTKGLSEKALRLKAEQIREVLGAKSSTVKGVKEIDKQRMNTFKERHPNFKVKYQDKAGRNRSREPSRAEWERAMQILGKIQKAEKGGKYDSSEQLFMAFQLATGDAVGITPENQEDYIDADNFLNESGDMLIHSDAFFSAADLEDTLDFFSIDTDDGE